MSETQQKILDAAERLIAEQGYSATSLRQIIAEAGVNLASVHYHFGSKEELLNQLVMRKVGPVNEIRLQLLERAIAEAAPASPSVERILEALMLPMAEAANRSPQTVKVMGRILAEGLLPQIVEKVFKPVLTAFCAAIKRAVPNLPDDEFKWRQQFMLGAMAHTMCGCSGAANDFEIRIAYLTRFLAAGFEAPACRTVEVTV
jgi:AcrR family transcriptional regulator